MPDREKVIKGLECCSIESECAKGTCPYYDDYLCSTHIAADALALLREQGPTKPTSGEWIWDRPHHFRCSVCDYVGGISVIADKYCPHCGSMMFLSETERKKEWRDERR